MIKIPVTVIAGGRVVIRVMAMPCVCVCVCVYYDNAAMRAREHWWKSGGAQILRQSGCNIAVGREIGAERRWQSGGV